LPAEDHERSRLDSASTATGSICSITLEHTRDVMLLAAALD
jgi:hypothetical protein